MRIDQDIGSEEQEPVKQSFCGSLRRDTHWKCLILTLLIYGCLSAIIWCRFEVITRYMDSFSTAPMRRFGSPCDDGYIYIPVAFVVMLYLVYLVECWHCHTRIELQYKVDVNTVYERIQAMRESIPIVWWKAICYHYVRRTRQVTRYRNGDAFTTTQVYYERVNSHSSSSAFDFSNCGNKDMSKNLVNLENYPATKIKFSKGFSFATVESENEFEDQRGQFFQEHERRDDYMETREGLDLLNVNFKEYMIAFADPNHLPWYVSHIIFWFLSFFLLSWPLRVLIEYKTAYVHYHVHKLFGVNYLDPNYQPGQMSRVSTMGSSELEMNIRNNYTIVPSYSEALLMDCDDATQDANGNFTTNNVIVMNGNVQHGGTPVTVASYANGHAAVIPNGHVPQNGHLSVAQGQNRARLNGMLPRSTSEGEQLELISKKRRYRRRRSKRHRQAVANQIHDTDDVTPQRQTPARSASHTAVIAAIASTPESPDEALPFAPSAVSCNDVCVVTSPEEEVEVVERIPPPAYEVALTMTRVPDSSENNTPTDTADETELPERTQQTNRPVQKLKCMETSL